MQCIKPFFNHITTVATKPIMLAMDHIISVVTTSNIAEHFTAIEVHFILIGMMATICLGLGSVVAVSLLRFMLNTIRVVLNFFSRTRATTGSVHSIHFTKHASSFNNETKSNSFDDSSVDDTSTPASAIVNNYTTHIHGPIINVGAEAVGTLRRMLDLGSTSSRLLGVDEESEDEEYDEQEEVEQDDGVTAVKN